MGDLSDELRRRRSGLQGRISTGRILMSTTTKRLRIGFIGAGTIGSFLIDRIHQSPELGMDVAIVAGRSERSKGRDGVRDRGINWTVDVIELLNAGIDVAVEAASHEALASAGVQCLARGIDLIPASVGALVDNNLLAALRAAANAGGSIMHIPSGGIGGIDAVQAAALVGIDRVAMTINKTPKAWSNVPYVLRHGFNLEHLHEPLTIFDGPARECVAEFPQDVNIAAVLSLAGIGFDRTHIKIVAHPTVTLNTYEIEWEGFTGRSRAVYENAFDPNNPKTTYLAAISTLAALTRIRSSYRIGT